MGRWLLRLMYELGSGRAVDNARREHEETARTMAGIAALEARLLLLATTTDPQAQPAAA